MKKYLFLLFLLIIYLVLIKIPKTINVLSYDDNEKTGVVTVVIDYKNGINSNDLILFLNNYNNEYYVSNLKISNHEVSVSCDDFNYCVNEVYEYFDKKFLLDHLTTGFKVVSISFIAYKDEVEKYLQNNKVDYEIY